MIQLQNEATILPYNSSSVQLLIYGSLVVLPPPPTFLKSLTPPPLRLALVAGSFGKGECNHSPKFDHDDGHWTLDMKRKKRDVAQGAALLAATALYHFILLILTCGATEADLSYGFERYPVFSDRYSRKGTGKYKHFMKVNKDDMYQIKGDEEDRPPDNYTFAPDVKYIRGGRTIKEKGMGAKVQPSDEPPSETVPRPKDHELADPHYVGGLKGNGEKHGRTRPAQKLKFFEEIRVIIYVPQNEYRRKSSLWVTNDLIVKNKQDHKTEKLKVLKLKERDKDLAAQLETVNEDGEVEEPPKKQEKKLSVAERVRIANKKHRKELKENPLPKERHSAARR